MKLLKGDNIKLLKELPDNSIDSVVTDPPYGLNFMNKKWDYQVPTKEFWIEVLRVLKPGGHILSFCGTRTYHRMVVNIEDAGFEIRDQLQWLYGSGFPKSHSIDEGIGSNLKPANEPICLARKPLSEKTLKDNYLKWGTGGINIDGCRVEFDMTDTNPATNPLFRHHNKDRYKQVTDHGQKEGENVKFTNSLNPPSEEGRFPANIILDEEAAKVLDKQSGYSKTKADLNYKYNNTECEGNTFTNRGNYTPRQDEGGASRFFYVAKVSSKERNLSSKNSHPTLKPINLMTYLCRLITPKGGIILDPFMGSGSTGIAALLEGFDFVGMEMDEEYFNIAETRIDKYDEYRKLLK